MDESTLPPPNHIPADATRYLIRSLTAALDRVRRQHSAALGDITTPIVRRALALAEAHDL